MYQSQYNPTLQNKLDEEKQVYTNESLADLANKLQSKVNEMTGEMTDKADELDAHIEEVEAAKSAFETIENEIQDLLDAINEMNEFESRIEDAISEADNLIN